MSESLTMYRGWFECPKRGRVDVFGWNETKLQAEDDLNRYVSLQENNPDPERGITTKVAPTQTWPEGKATVLLDEEYGYRTWLWHTDMTDAELIAWWKALPSVDPYFMTPMGLPGKLVPCWLEANSNKGVWTFTRESANEDDEGWKGEEVFINWPSDKDPAEDRWMGHIHCDDDSGIGHPVHGRVLHAGYDNRSLEDVD